MKRKLTCIVCPIGCTLEVELAGKEVLSVKGNTCPRGERYAVSECTAPERTVTTTVRCTDGAVLPVKTVSPIPKEKVFACMAELNRIVLPLPVRRGDVVVRNVAGTEVDVVATASSK